MKHSKKSKMCMAISVLLFLAVIFGSLYLGGGVVLRSDVPPDIYISAEGERTKEALTGNKSAVLPEFTDAEDIQIRYSICDG